MCYTPPLISSSHSMCAFGPLTPNVVHHPALRLHLFYRRPYIIISLSDTSAFTALLAHLISNWCLSELTLNVPCEKGTVIFQIFFLFSLMLERFWVRFIHLLNHTSIRLPCIRLFQLHGPGENRSSRHFDALKNPAPLWLLLRWRYMNL